MNNPMKALALPLLLLIRPQPDDNTKLEACIALDLPTGPAALGEIVVLPIEEAGNAAKLAMEAATSALDGAYQAHVAGRKAQQTEGFAFTQNVTGKA